MKNLLIIVLLVGNFLSISIIWMMTSRTVPMQSAPHAGNKDESVLLLKKELQLTDEQTKKLEQIHSGKLEILKQYNDSLNSLKQQLALELCKPQPDTLATNRGISKIATLHAKAEQARFDHFNELLAICSPEQREKLKPVLIAVFDKRPPKQREAESNIIQQNSDKAVQQIEQPAVTVEPQPIQSAKIEQKLIKLTMRLQLNESQITAVQQILIQSEQMREELRIRRNPDKDEIENEKQKILENEDLRISQILTAFQKSEYEKMQQKRRENAKGRRE